MPTPVKGMASGEPGALLVIEMLPLAVAADAGANAAVKVVLWPALRVSGTVSPVRLKPAPVAAAAEIVMLAVPEFISVIVWEPLLPTKTFPKLKLAGLAERDPWVPEPVKAIVDGEPGALLVIEIDPVAPVVAEAGVNVELKLVLCPAFRVKGRAAKPLTPKPEPKGFMAVIVRAVLPVLLSETLCEPVLPTATLPKFTLVGEMVSCGCACVPVPFKGIASGEPGASLTIETLPVRLPTEAGANFAENEVLCPGFKVSGADTPVRVKPVPEAVMPEMLAAVVPELVKVNTCVPVLPTRTLPKLKLEGLAARAACVPAPVSATVTVGSEAPLVMVILPEALPVPAGAN